MTTPEQVRGALAMAVVEKLAKDAGVKIRKSSKTGEWTLKGLPTTLLDMLNLYAKD